MEKITVVKKRLLILLSLSDVVISLNNNIYSNCRIDCNKCKFFDKGCYYSKTTNNAVLDELYREEVILKWLKGE